VELFEKAGDLPKPHLARAYLRAGDKEKAEKLAREAMESSKNQVYPLATCVEVLFELGKEDEAKQAEAKKLFDDLRALAAWSDLKAPIFDRLDDVARVLGHEGPWTLPRKEAADVGARPPIDSFGPLLWRPAPAVAWTLPDSEGRPVSLSQYGGRPVVVIFYLGYGCLECAKQLKAFAPMAKEFNDAGVQLVAISTDSIDDLKRSIESANGGEAGINADQADQEESDQIQKPSTSEFSIKLLSNSDLRAFRAYRAYDDFEQRALHGTFLIDGHGMIRWQETGATPFVDAAFLLEEAKRIQSLSR
jgi:peroxiredoxin